jgi:5'-nucleotidase/UDP-sugar diphosphatase
VIVLNAGDNIFSGAELNASIEKGIPFYETIAMERIGYDVSALGNHDFDFGPDILAEFISGFRSLPFVSANLDFLNEPALNALARDGRLEGNLVADSVFSEARRHAASFGTRSPDLAIINGGAIRNDSVIPAGGITELDTFEIVPFPNLLAIVPNIPASQLKEILENAVSQVDNFDGRFAQVSGIRFTWDPSGTAQVLESLGNVTSPGTRIREVTLKNGTVLVSGGAVVSSAPAVAIAVTTFLATGGDQYPFRGAPFTNLGLSSQQTLFNYIVHTLSGHISAADYPEPGEGRITKL